MNRVYVPVFGGGKQVGFVESGALSIKLRGEVTRLLLITIADSSQYGRF